MPLASTLTDIANLALASIGEKRIQNIDDDDQVSQDIRNTLYQSMREVQLEILWEDLVVVMKPTLSTETYDLNTDFKIYNLPTNFLDMVALKSGDPWFLSAGKLVTQDADPTIAYKRFSEEPTEWSGYLAELTYRKLAMNTAMSLTQNTQVTQMAVAAYDQSKLNNLARSSNRQRDTRQRARGYGNLRSRRISSNRWPFIFFRS